MVKTVDGQIIDLNVAPHDTLHDVKAKIMYLTGIPTQHARLAFAGQLLKDDFGRLSSYNIQDMSHLRLLEP